MEFDLNLYLDRCRHFVEEGLTSHLPPETSDPVNLQKAIRYSLFAPGKRVRPALVFASADALGLEWNDVLPIAVALEMVHVFSLIHDDLPAMDDDDLRRGQPTNHKVFGEAMAILAGDALLAQAFVPLTELNQNRFSGDAIINVIRELAHATGVAGMIGGQVIDMESEGKNIDLDRLKVLHRLKTGALIRFAVVAPALLSGQNQNTLTALDAYAQNAGLAFQIADDILDVEGGAEIGKDVGSDARRGKSTYPAILGMEAAKMERARVFECALKALESLGDKTVALKAIARFIVERRK